MTSNATWTKYETWFTVPGTVGDTDLIYISLNTDADAVTQLYDEVVVTSMSRSVQDLFKGGQLEFYTGLQPSSPDDAPTGTLLLTTCSPWLCVYDPVRGQLCAIASPPAPP